MEKPIKPKKPVKPKLSAPDDFLRQSYVLVTDYSTNPWTLRLVLQDDPWLDSLRGDFHFEHRINFSTLQQLCLNKGLLAAHHESGKKWNSVYNTIASRPIDRIYYE